MGPFLKRMALNIIAEKLKSKNIGSKSQLLADQAAFLTAFCFFVFNTSSM